MVSFKPKQITKKILSPLNDRALEVLHFRFGLNDDSERKTLESIGQKYGITRERVRQIENAALNTIRKSDEFKSEQWAFQELEKLLHNLGGIIAEEDLLNSLSKDKCIQNHFHFYFYLGDQFKKHKEDGDFKARWSVNDDLADDIHESLKNLYENLTDDEILSENDMISRFLDEVKNISDHYKNEEIVKRWLGISKKIGQNPFGEWGKADSPNVNVRGIRDYSYLVMRRQGNPMHFREVAKSISECFGRDAHVATCHNELIKDPRFVLVGRGMYALKDWGYTPGVVRDVIREILKKEGPLSREDVVEKVLKERYLKKNTILVNLQNSKYFKKMKDGRYAVVS